MTDGVVLYLRVSTEEQDLAGQERELRGYAGRKGWKVASTYAEKVSATGRVERAAHDALLQEVVSSGRSWQHVLVWSLDRWSRDGSLVKVLGSLEDLEKVGVRFHSLREPELDTSDDGTPSFTAKILRGILPTLAALEAQQIRERTKVAMGEIRAGRRQTSSGKMPGHQPVLTEEKVARILEMRARTPPVPHAQIAQAVGLRESTVRYAYSAASHGTLVLAKPRAGKLEPSEGDPSRL